MPTATSSHVQAIFAQPVHKHKKALILSLIRFNFIPSRCTSYFLGKWVSKDFLNVQTVMAITKQPPGAVYRLLLYFFPLDIFFPSRAFFFISNFNTKVILCKMQKVMVAYIANIWACKHLSLYLSTPGLVECTCPPPL